MGVEVRDEDGGSGDQPTMADEILAGGGDARPDDRETVEAAENALADIRPDDAPDPDDEAEQMGFGSGDWGTVDKPPYEIPDTAEIRAREGESGHDLVSTFSGCGGTSAGFRWAGFDVLWASEFVEAARETYEANWPSTPVDPRDIRDVTCEEILDEVGRDVGEVDVLEGGPPCAAFSVSGKREYDSDDVKKYSDTEQRVDDLFHEFLRLVDGIEPKVFLIENVPSLVTGGAEAVFREIMGLLRDAGSHGYVVDARVLNAKHHGAPQSRARLFIQGVRRDLREAHDVMPAYPRDLRYQYSIRDAIPWVGENAEIQWDEKSFNDEDEPHPADEPCPTLMAGGLGGVAHHQGKIANADWAAMIPDEEQEVANDLRKYAIGDAWLRIDPGEQSEKYFNLVRPDPDEPCPTITQTGGSYGAASVTHPHEPRKFTIPELRRLAGFPDDFELTGSYRQRWERLGRAVPPPLSKRIAEAIRDEILNPIEEQSDE